MCKRGFVQYIAMNAIYFCCKSSLFLFCFEIYTQNLGPQNNEIPVLGKYTQARAILPRLKYLVENYGDETVTFNNEREVTMAELIDEFVEQMDLVYNYVIHEIEPNEEELGSESEEWQRWLKAKTLFINANGLQDGGTSYGIVLNGVGTAVVGFGKRKEGTSNITLNNVEIFGIQMNSWERMWSKIGNERQFQGFLFDTLGLYRLYCIFFIHFDWFF